jgi:hypothetical protein
VEKVKMILGTEGQEGAAKWLCFDIETGNAPKADIEAALEGWKPPGNIKDKAKIEERRAEAEEKIKDRGALLDSSPILCVGMINGTNGLMISGMPGSAELNGWECRQENTEKGMLMRLRHILDEKTGPETILVGHNIRGFDLPKLRNAYIRHRMALPFIFKHSMRGEQAAVQIADTMQMFKSFSMENRDNMFIGLETVCKGLGIPRPKQVISGADCPRLFEEGEFAQILTYCAVDVAATSRAFALMSGLAADLT